MYSLKMKIKNILSILITVVLFLPNPAQARRVRERAEILFTQEERINSFIQELELVDLWVFLADFRSRKYQNMTLKHAQERIIRWAERFNRAQNRFFISCEEPLINKGAFTIAWLKINDHRIGVFSREYFNIPENHGTVVWEQEENPSSELNNRGGIIIPSDDRSYLEMLDEMPILQAGYTQHCALTESMQKAPFSRLQEDIQILDSKGIEAADIFSDPDFPNSIVSISIRNHERGKSCTGFFIHEDENYYYLLTAGHAAVFQEPSNNLNIPNIPIDTSSLQVKVTISPQALSNTNSEIPLVFNAETVDVIRSDSKCVDAWLLKISKDQIPDGLTINPLKLEISTVPIPIAVFGYLDTSGQKELSYNISKSMGNYFSPQLGYLNIGTKTWKGCSGGPIFDLTTGNVIGIMSAIGDTYSTITPSQELIEFIQKNLRFLNPYI